MTGFMPMKAPQHAHTQLKHGSQSRRAVRPQRGIRRARTITQAAAPGLAKQIFKQHEGTIQGDPTRFLQITEAYWKALKASTVSPPKTAKEVVKTHEGAIAEDLHVDLTVCGGTLGVFVALALQLKGFSTCIVEKRKVEGRTQEWNISRGEIQALVDLELVTREELEAAIVTEFNPIRVGFNGGEDLWVNDVLNLGVSPEKLIRSMRARYLAAGGVMLEGTAFTEANVYSNGVRLSVKRGAGAGPLELGDTNRPNAVDASVYSNSQSAAAAAPAQSASTAAVSPKQQLLEEAAASGEIRTRLLVDCMGHFSDIVKQMRVGTAPDGMCLVVGSCAEGIPEEANQSGDLLYTFTDAEDDMQLFWEAFPAEGGRSRTTYMFTYTDADPSRPSFEHLLNRYFELLPSYQGVSLNDLSFKRVLFGGFPCYNNGPLQSGFDRVLQVGDASASASPLSFGGFGSMVRHIPRLSEAISGALASDRLTRSDLALIQPYQPSLSASWLFQRSMSLRAGQLAPDTPAEAAAAAAAAAASASPAPRTPQLTNNIVSAMPLSLKRSVPTASAPLSSTLPSTTSTALTTASSASSASITEGSSSSGWIAKDHINRLLACNFGVMAVLGDRCLRPFLQDSIVLGPLSLTMAGMMLADPFTIFRVVGQVGPLTLLSWFGHYSMLLTYRLLYLGLRPLRPVIPNYYFQRVLDALQYGSGSDYRYHAPAQQVSEPKEGERKLLPSGRDEVEVGVPMGASEGWVLDRTVLQSGEYDGVVLRAVPLEQGVWERRWREGKSRV